MTIEVVEVLYALERDAMVEVFRRDDGTFGFSEWRFWRDELLWSPRGGLSEAVLDSLETALREAKGRVEWLAAEKRPRVYTLSWIRTLSKDPEATFEVSRIPVFRSGESSPACPSGLGEQLAAKQILSVGGLYLVETLDEPDNWYMGSMHEDGYISCRGPYGSLENAIRTL